MRSEQKSETKEWLWVKPLTADAEFIPSFEDWYRMLQALRHCETRKYAWLAMQGRDPVDMIKAFFKQALEGVPFEQLRRDFKIPKRAEGVSRRTLQVEVWWTTFSNGQAIKEEKVWEF